MKESSDKLKEIEYKKNGKEETLSFDQKEKDARERNGN